MQSTKTKNLIFLGSTGQGKSSCCNFLCGRNQFKVGEGMVSQTLTGRSALIPSLNLNVIDTIGFGDQRIPQQHVDDIITQITTNLINFQNKGTNCIDCFVMVTKCTPRAESLKRDIEHMINLFGSVALESLVILLITEGKWTDKVIQEEIRKMSEVVGIMKKRRKDQPRDWYVHWDNHEPRENQTEKLMQAVGRVKQYVARDYLGSREEINDRLDKRINKKLNEERRLIQEDLSKTEAQKEFLRKRLEKQLKQQREQCMQAAANSSQQFQKLSKMIADLNKQGNDDLKKLMQDAQQQSRQMQQAVLTNLQQQGQKQTQRFKEMQQSFQKTNAQFLNACQQLANKPPQVVYEGGGGNPLQKLIGLTAGLTSFVSGVGGLFTAFNGVKTLWGAATAAKAVIK